MSGESSDEEKDGVPELPDLNEVMKAKEKDPMMFVSGFEADDDGILGSDNPDDPGQKLLEASQDGQLNMIEQLLNTDPDLINHRDVDGYTALHRACYEDQLEAARLLISRGARVDAESNEDCWTPLHSACNWNAYHCVRLLLENGANVNAQTGGGLTPLHLACGNQQARETLIILLTEPGVNIEIKSKSDETPLQLAERNGQLSYLFEMHRKSVIKI